MVTDLTASGDETVRVEFQPGTAAGHAAVAVPIAGPGDRVDTLLADMRGRQFDCAAVVAVCSEGRLVGLATIEQLLAAPADATEPPGEPGEGVRRMTG